MSLFTDTHVTTLSPSSSCLRRHCIRVTLARMPYVDGRAGGESGRAALPLRSRRAAAQVGEVACCMCDNASTTCTSTPGQVRENSRPWRKVNGSRGRPTGVAYGSPPEPKEKRISWPRERGPQGTEALGQQGCLVDYVSIAATRPARARDQH